MAAPERTEEFIVDERLLATGTRERRAVAPRGEARQAVPDRPGA